MLAGVQKSDATAVLLQFLEKLGTLVTEEGKGTWAVIRYTSWTLSESLEKLLFPHISGVVSQWRCVSPTFVFSS